MAPPVHGTDGSTLYKGHWLLVYATEQFGSFHFFVLDGYCLGLTLDSHCLSLVLCLETERVQESRNLGPDR